MQRDASVSRRSGQGFTSIVELDPVAALARKTGKLKALDRALRQTLPLPLRDEVRFAQLRDARLVFLASSPAWASRLRLHQAHILVAARAIGVNASSVIVKVASLPAPEPQPEPAKRLSSAAALHLKAAASALEDPQLQAMFLALAAVAGPGNTPAPSSPAPSPEV